MAILFKNIGMNAVLRTPDTDIFVVLLCHAHAMKLTVYFDMGSRKHRRLVILSDFAVNELITELSRISVFTMP